MRNDPAPPRPCVQRTFELDGEPLVARFFVPEQAATGEYRCRWTIAWPGKQTEERTCGEDGIQALMLAMQAAHMELTATVAYRAGRLTLWGQRDLDLPPGWGTGPLYAIPAPPADAPSDDG